MSCSDSDQSPREIRRRRKRRYWQRNRKANIPRVPAYSSMSHAYASQPDQGPRSRFAATGLQVIVKMGSVQLTPDKPTFPEGRWHIEGQMNERIAGTAIYYLESENVTPSHLSFRMQTDYEQDEFASRIRQAGYGWAEQVYGVCLGDNGSPCLQNYGSVEIKEERLLAFPNVFHTRHSGFELEDKTKPGYQMFITLWLVDPSTRILSTANVPPQQGDWWLERIFGSAEASGELVPPEILQLIRERVSGGVHA
ncbi:DUF4246 family protein, partial [Candidatus Bathyarchaeota archaeon]|nr:DUF4246 family protein [Candidatus Bathyarchaeota archaeon]